MGDVGLWNLTCMTRDEGLRMARDLLRSRRTILVLTGAGVSAESGVPTFRGPDGLWKTHRPEQLATPEAFRGNPLLVWEWYNWRRNVVATCEPNPAHRALAHLTLFNSEAQIATQNVDGLHSSAIEEASEIAEIEPPFSAMPLELHGSLFRVRCTGCNMKTDHRDAVDVTSIPALPHCQECGTLLRPDVVWFGEPLNPHTLDEAMTHARTAEVCLVVGTSSVVHPVASLPWLTRRAGGVVIEVNPEATPLTETANVSVRGTAAHIIPEILSQ